MKNSLYSGGRNALCRMLTLFLLVVGLYAGGAKALSGTVAGKVLLDGKPAAGAKVTLVLLGKPHATTTTDALGQFKITGIWMGIYDVQATLGSLQTMVKGIKVKLSETSTVSLNLKTPTPVAPAISHQVPVPSVEPSKVLGVDTRVHEQLTEPEEILWGESYDAVEAVPEPEIVSNGDESFDEWDGGDDFGEEAEESYMIIRSEPLPMDREGYAHIAENRFHEALQTPLSTFAIDVDAGSYTNCRRMLLQEQRLPPAAAVRIEEFINYFDYDYPQPTGIHPFSITTELSTCPWNAQHQLVHVGLQGRKMDMGTLPPANLVFLLDVSGSMDEPNKLPLVKQGLELLVNQLRPEDHVAIVVYAGAAGLVLPSTPGNQRAKIIEAMAQLKAGGSTAGGEGIALAYKTAREHARNGSNSRVILCTDGDFNVGISSDGELVSMIEQERETGIFLSVMGFGTGNYQDAKMEQLADHGNGNYNYIDQLLEAKRVFVSEVGGTLNTIAKDVKIQVEFNPAVVQSYRLVGYENRHLENEDFDDDKKDAGELGAGHSVTALYEIVPAAASTATTGALRYQQQSLSPKAATGELLTVKFRYKAPDGDVSQLIEQQCAARPVDLLGSSENFKFSAAVAAFGMLLRDSEHKGAATYEVVKLLARAAKGSDVEGNRAEFLKMVETAALLGDAQAER